MLDFQHGSGRPRTLARLALAAAAATVLAAQTTPPTPLVTLPIQIANDYHLYLEARLNGAGPLRCSLDSGGGDRAYLDRQKAASLGIQATSQGRSGGPQSSTLAADERARVNWELGGLPIRDVELVMQNRPNPDFTCVIGAGILRSYVVEVDYDASRLRLFDGEKYQPAGGARAVPFTLEGGTPFVDVDLTFPTGNPVRAHLAVDTGGGRYSAYLTRTFAERHKLAERMGKTAPDLRSGSSNGRPNLLGTRVEKLALGGVEIARPIVFLRQMPGFGGAREPDGLLCPDVLRRFRLVIDYPRRRLLLEPGARFGDETPFDASGALIYRGANTPFRAAQVLPDSPAAAAGLQPGDTILEVDGKPAQALSNAEMMTALSQAGRELTLLLQRGEEKRTVKLKLARLL